MANKLTKKEKFNMVLEMVKENEMLKEFIEHELELLEKKSGSGKETKTQKENAVLKNKLVVALGEFEKPVTIAEFQAKSNSELACLSTSKLSALLNQMCKEENPRVVRTEEKKRAFFSVA
jgi:uncharacterized protein (DUF2344 family)